MAGRSPPSAGWESTAVAWSADPGTGGAASSGRTSSTGGPLTTSDAARLIAARTVPPVNQACSGPDTTSRPSAGARRGGARPPPSSSCSRSRAGQGRGARGGAYRPRRAAGPARRPAPRRRGWERVGRCSRPCSRAAGCGRRAIAPPGARSPGTVRDAIEGGVAQAASGARAGAAGPRPSRRVAGRREARKVEARRESGSPSRGAASQESFTSPRRRAIRTPSSAR